MACYHPSTVTVSRKGLAGRVADRVRVPCGWCLGCRSDQARGWAVRMVHESVVSPPAWFVTLTYNPEVVPENGTLRPRDVTLFLKRLRASEGNRRVSYFYSGEYGEKNARPHYHAVLFGPEFLDRDRRTTRHGAPVFTSGALEDAWGLGFCEFTGMTFAGARYVASYVRQKVRVEESPGHYTRVNPLTGELIELVPEFARMSRRPAIGRKWIQRYWTDVYPRDFVVMEGRPLKPPRYYDKWMEENHPRVMMDVKEQRLRDIVEIGDEELIMREKCHRARVNFFQGRDKV